MKTLKEFWPVLPVVGAAALRAAPHIAKAITRAGPSTLATAPVTGSQAAKSAWNKAKTAYKNRKVMGVKAPKKVKEDVPTMNTGAIPDPKSTAMGPSQLFKPRTVTDKRYKSRAVMLKRFREYIQDKHAKS
tara:strand:+ start:1678 stop:2070 length:393 start_codon:yes stop_codon:yes gene_type:complete